jgi:hypothetical protein
MIAVPYLRIALGDHGNSFVHPEFHVFAARGEMKLFTCPNCGHPLYFESSICESCAARIGYSSQRKGFIALANVEASHSRAVSQDACRYCANARYDVCNWVVPGGHAGEFCTACRHNRTIPEVTSPENLVRWRKIEVAKHRLFYTLLRLRLPLTTRPEDPDGLAFDFLSTSKDGSGARVSTGHSSGLITLNLAEADDAERERERKSMGESYRTLLGHFRHEIGHYYWDHLIRDTAAIERFRSLFGDERSSYNDALDRYYTDGPDPGWPDRFVTPYASSHPWEDFAETWAHYFHMIDTLETAGAFGMRLRPEFTGRTELATEINFDPHEATIDRIVSAWVPLAFAVNSVNRSMGQPDLYPFTIAPLVIWKLSFVHDEIRAVDSGRQPKPLGDEELRAVIALLKRSVSSPEPRPG